MIYPVLGIDENGKVAMLISPIQLEVIGTRNLRGNPPPASVLNLIDGNEEAALTALRDMHKYYNTFYSKKRK